MRALMACLHIRRRTVRAQTHTRSHQLFIDVNEFMLRCKQLDGTNHVGVAPICSIWYKSVRMMTGYTALVAPFDAQSINVLIRLFILR